MAEWYTTEEMLAGAQAGLQAIGYVGRLVQTNYPFADALTEDYRVREIELAAFAQEPFSYRTACFGIALPSHLGPEAIRPYRALGAPQILALYPEEQQVRRWQIRARGEPKLVEEISPAALQARIAAQQDEWNPASMLRAKEIGFAQREAIQLDLVDVGLLPALDEEVRQKLDRLLKDVLASSKAIYQEQALTPLDPKALYRLVFRLLAAKLWVDRGGHAAWGQWDAQQVIAEIERIYFRRHEGGHVLANELVQERAWEMTRSAFHFQNLSVEALAYVYENTLVTEESRAQLDIHATPATLAEYMVRALPFEELALDKRRVFEPFAGHAPFLIAAMGRLRTLLPLSMEFAARHTYLTQMLAGMEIDPFALEVAWHSLILADFPNPDGWDLVQGDVFSSPRFDTYAQRANIVLLNPPYSNFSSQERQHYTNLQLTNKAAEGLFRVLQHQPLMLGALLPLSFVEKSLYRQSRHHMNELYDTIEIIELPNNVFRHSRFETALVTAYGRRTDEPKRHTVSFNRREYQDFLHTEESPIFEDFPLLSADGNTVFRANPLPWLWDELAHLPGFAKHVEIHKGIEYNIPLQEHEEKLVAQEPRPGFARGLVRVKDGFEPYLVAPSKYLNTNPSVMRYKAYNLPWDQPKVIVNGARLSLGPWKITAVVDAQGLWCYENFFGVWPTGSLPIEVIAAILNGPVANAFIESHSISQIIRIQLLKRVPTPHFGRLQQERLVSLVQEYRQLREMWLAGAGDPSRISQQCWEIMATIDAVVLTAYDLSPRTERRLLDLFARHQRPGPVPFERYYPEDYQPAIPWRVYISQAFQAATAQKTLARLPVIDDPTLAPFFDELE